MSKTQSAFDKNLKSLTQTKPKTKTKTKPKSNTIKFTKTKDTKLFPYSTFHWRLEDKREKKTCWFQCYEHAEKYIHRYKMKTTEYTLQTNQ